MFSSDYYNILDDDDAGQSAKVSETFENILVYYSNFECEPYTVYMQTDNPILIGFQNCCFANIEIFTISTLGDGIVHVWTEKKQA